MAARVLMMMMMAAALSQGASGWGARAWKLPVACVGTHALLMPTSPLLASQASIDDLVYNPPDYLLRLVDTFPNQRLSVSDVVAGAGQTFQTAKRDLMALAIATNAILEVTKDGEIMYSFPYDAKTVVLKKSWARRLRVSLRTVQRALAYLLRVSVGLLLLASLLTVTAAVFSIQVGAEPGERDEAQDRKDSETRRRNDRPRPRSRGLDLNLLLDLDTLRCFFSFSPSSSQVQTMNFLEACHSFVFGDAADSAEFKRARWARAAEVIRSNLGVVVAEDLAAHMPAPPPLSAPDESWLLPLLLRFNGQPQATPAGNIVYRFDELMATARPALPASVEQPLLEEQLRFSRASPQQILAALALGAANLLGVLRLSRLLTRFPGPLRRSPSLALLVRALPALQGYAVAYLAIPLVRLVLMRTRNADIEARNSLRRAWAGLAQKPSPALRDKLREKAALCHAAPYLVAGALEPEVVFNSAQTPALKPAGLE